MHSLHYLREQMTKIHKNKRKLTKQLHREHAARPTSGAYLQLRRAHGTTLETFPSCQSRPERMITAQGYNKLRYLVRRLVMQDKCILSIMILRWCTTN